MVMNECTESVGFRKVRVAKVAVEVSCDYYGFVGGNESGKDVE